ncbi:hypothetical protein EGJ52_24580 [Pseudomonas luteola]|uniref:hypothetical protein n=1 Tax=Pseudomonas luteola TaxID=47886 RepID=UPI000F7A0762|nr:hypothetical protein [Pseudomonas luteola]MCG7374102.1 hypothetical protein [Pseudomonas luteola]RRW39485.1 hypothetical protein EGJ52_24580 [Pseudomonas luteola]
MFDRINNLVAKDGFTLLIWDDRYGKGVRAGLGIVHSDMDTVSSTSEDGDLDMTPAMEYVFSADWLPYVTGDSVADALSQLETRLAKLPEDQLTRDSLWSTLTSQAIETLRTAYQEATDYSRLPASWADAIEQCVSQAE